MKDNNNLENISNIERYLRRIDYIIRKKGRAILSDYNMTIPQFTALQILIHHENLTIGELSQRMALACSTITDLIDRMEKSELVERQRDEKDKRVVRINVLPKGYDILEKVLNERREFLKGKFTDFSTEEISSLNKGLEALYQAMDDKK